MRTNIFLIFCCCLFGSNYGKYTESWDSLDTRPLPQWYDKAKFGIFVHWGVYSVPAFGNEWFWQQWTAGQKEFVNYMEKNYKPDFTYQDFASDFTAEFFNASQWAALFKRSGAKYVVLTSKHHEGFALWPSKYSYSWNSQDVGPHRDIVGELSKAVRNENLVFGLYHSLYEWFHPLYMEDKEKNTTNFVDNKVYPELVELINTYQPEVLWSDGEWEQPATYWKSLKFLTWLYNESPVKDTIITNDRWGSDITCKHGDVLTCQDRYNPGVLQSHKWENAMTTDWDSWGFRRNADIGDFARVDQIIQILTQTVSCGGNLLLNVGPTKEGTIAPIFQERLDQMGDWLAINGEAIYETVPWTTQNDTLTSEVWYTSTDNAVYAIILNWPKNNKLELAAALPILTSDASSVELVGNDGKLSWTKNTDSVSIEFPDKATVKSEWAWVLKIST